MHAKTPRQIRLYIPTKNLETLMQRHVAFYTSAEEPKLVAKNADNLILKLCEDTYA